jgi:hypothetical protein
LQNSQNKPGTGKICLQEILYRYFSFPFRLPNKIFTSTAKLMAVETGINTAYIKWIFQAY